MAREDQDDIPGRFVRDAASAEVTSSVGARYAEGQAQSVPGYRYM